MEENSQHLFKKISTYLHKPSISIFSIAILLLLIISALPIYPCEVHKERWSLGQGVTESWTERDYHAPFIVIFNGFEWSDTSYFLLIDSGVSSTHKAEPIYLLFILIFYSVLLLLMGYWWAGNSNNKNKTQHLINILTIIKYFLGISAILYFLWIFFSTIFGVPIPVKSHSVLIAFFIIVIPAYAIGAWYCSKKIKAYKKAHNRYN